MSHLASKDVWPIIFSHVVRKVNDVKALRLVNWFFNAMASNALTWNQFRHIEAWSDVDTIAANADDLHWYHGFYWIRPIDRYCRECINMSTFAQLKEYHGRFKVDLANTSMVTVDVTPYANVHTVNITNADVSDLSPLINVNVIDDPNYISRYPRMICNLTALDGANFIDREHDGVVVDVSALAGVNNIRPDRAVRSDRVVDVSAKINIHTLASNITKWLTSLF
jgi:hypothetical protein